MGHGDAAFWTCNLAEDWIRKEPAAAQRWLIDTALLTESAKSEILAGR